MITELSKGGWVSIYYVKNQHSSCTRSTASYDIMVKKDLTTAKKEKSKNKCKYTQKYIMHINTDIEFHKQSVRYKSLFL